MDTSMISDVLREGVGVAIRIAAPMLLLSMLVGVTMAIFQAVTQIHEQTISFILKLVVVGGVLLIGGARMLELLQDFARSVFGYISG